MMKKRILMLGTGGTIACKHTDEGLSPAITPKELVEDGLEEMNS